MKKPRWKVLVSAPYMQPVIDRFRPVFARHRIELIVPNVRERLSETALLGLIADIDGVICGDDRFTAKVLGAAKKLKVISKWGTGIDSIDRQAAGKLGIAVHNTPNAFTDPVADTVLAYILSFARQVPWAAKNMRSGKWEKRKGSSLKEKTLGVIGLGNIGQAVVRRALAFGMTVIGNDIKPMPASFLKKTGVRMLTKAQLLKKADFVSLNCDLNPSSFHLMGQKEFALMKPTAYLINTARGPIVEEAALVKALGKGQITGAALDVYEEEPLSRQSPLRKMEHCLLSAHDANSSPSAWEYVHQNTINNLLKVLHERG